MDISEGWMSLEIPNALHSSLRWSGSVMRTNPSPNTKAMSMPAPSVARDLARIQHKARHIQRLQRRRISLSSKSSASLGASGREKCADPAFSHESADLVHAL